MAVVDDPAADVSPYVTAALLLVAITRLRELRLPHPTGTAALDTLGVSRSRAYELKGRLEAQLEELVKAPGRPPKAAAPEPAPPSLATELLGYVVAHPGSIRLGPSRRTYSDGLRLFVLELLQRHGEVPLEACAQALTIPLGTLKDWLRGETTAVQRDRGEPPKRLEPRGPQLQTLLNEWDQWHGTFIAFCAHVQQHCRLPFGRAHIAKILEACGVRIPKRRPGRPPDEDALRDAFIVWFPHAQWVGDGSLVPVEVDGQLFVFNVELDVDAYSGAFVGAEVSRTEDSAAVVATFRDAIASTGDRPLALLLDNKPSNHTKEVVDALGGTVLMPATPYRPQNKAHVEGAFGLLKPNLAGLALQASGSPEEIAASYLRCVVTAVCRAINHRPRRDRDNRSRVELLQDVSSPAEIERARQALEALVAKQKTARETRAARQSPTVRAVLAAAYARIGLDDPQGHLLTATAGYPLDAVVEGIAIFESRKAVGALPDSADARYLLGIVRNLASEHETWALAEALWAQRVAAGDLLAQRLARQAARAAGEHQEPSDLIDHYVRRALQADSRLERFFWLTATADVINAQPLAQHHPLFRLAARRIAATHVVHPKERNAALRFLAAKVRPLR